LYVGFSLACGLARLLHLLVGGELRVLFKSLCLFFGDAIQALNTLFAAHPEGAGEEIVSLLALVRSSVTWNRVEAGHSFLHFLHSMENFHCILHRLPLRSAIGLGI